MNYGLVQTTRPPPAVIIEERFVWKYVYNECMMDLYEIWHRGRLYYTVTHRLIYRNFMFLWDHFRAGEAAGRSQLSIKKSPIVVRLWQPQIYAKKWTQ